MAQPEIELPLGRFVDLDRNGPVPLYHQLSVRIEQAIDEGVLPPGSRLENELSIGERLRVSRPTVRRAIQDLVDKGLLVRRRGIGTQVVHGPVQRRVELSSLYEDLDQAGKSPGTRVLTHEIVDAPPRVAAALSIDEGSPVLHLRRVRIAEDAPIALLENWLPRPFLDLEPDALEGFGLYQILRSMGTSISVARQRIGARLVQPAEATLLEVDRGSAVLTAERTAYDANGDAVEFGLHLYRADRYSFDITLVDK